MGRTLAFVAAVLFAAQSAEGQDRFTGVFETDGMVVYLVPTPDGDYRGRIEAGLETFNLEAESQWGLGLVGNYERDGRETQFAATVIAGQLVLGDGISTYYLSRTTDVVPPDIVSEVLALGEPSAAEPSHSTPAPVSEPAFTEEESPQWTVDEAASTEDQVFEDVYQGYRFSTPSGWVGTQTADGAAFQSNTVAGTLLVTPHDRPTIAALTEDARVGLQDPSGHLSIEGDVQLFGSDGVTAAYVGSIQGQPVRARAISRLSSHGGGLTVLVVATDADFQDAHERAARSLAESIELFEPQPTDAAYDWRELLTGARLTYMYSYYSGGSPDGAYVGASEETTIDLCQAGHFYFGSSGSFSADGGGSVAGGQYGGQQGSGAWNVTLAAGQPTLRLSFHDGSTQEYTLSRAEDGKTLLNGTRYFRTYAGSPVESARPACP